MIQFQCECGQYYRVEEWREGDRFVCPYCDRETTVSVEDQDGPGGQQEASDQDTEQGDGNFQE